MGKRYDEDEPKMSYGFYAIFGIVTYFIWCDLSFFSDLAAERDQHLHNKNMKVTTAYPIKLRVQDHFGRYIDYPLAEWIDKTFGISKIPFVTPNLITLIHFFFAMAAGRFLASPRLHIRRIGVILFLIRSTLDMLDGVVHRAQSSDKEIKSGWGTYGYLIDASADTFGSIFVLIGILYRFTKNPPIKNPDIITKLKAKEDVESKERLFLSDDSCSEENDNYYGVKRYSKPVIYFTALSFAVFIFIRSSIWDYFNHNYYDLLTTARDDISPAKQAEVLGYTSTWFSLWLVSINTADAFMSYSLFAIFFGKIWIWMRFNLYFTIPNLLVYCTICQIHLMKMREILGVNR